jgi:hypothetical protein
MLTDYLSIVVDADDEAAALDLIVREGCTLLYRSEYTGIGEVGLKVHVPHSEQLASGESVVERANRYHNHPAIKQAAPAFAPLYPTQTAAPSDPYYYVDQIQANGPEWYFVQQKMDEAWGLVYGADWTKLTNETAPIIVVASMDNGVMMNYSSPGTPTAYTAGSGDPTNAINGHPDLVGNQWFNQAEKTATPALMTT